jgi:polar amino acid transport system permease protein
LLRSKTKLTTLDIILSLLVLMAIIYIVYKIKIGLSYRWNWSAIPQYFYRYDPTEKKWVSNILMQGFLTTIRLSFWATILATFVGTLMGLFRVSRSLFRRLVGGTYVELIRNLPPLVIIFIFYFFVGDQILPVFGVEELIRNSSESTQQIVTVLFAKPSLFTAFLSALVTLSIFEGAYITIAVMYLILTLSCSLAVERLEIYMRKNSA